MSGDALRRIGLSLVGIGLFLALWQVIGVYRLAGITWPPLTAVLAMLTDPGKTALFQRAFAATAVSALEGYAAGAVIGIGLALCGHLAPPVKPGADRIAAVVAAVPPIALGPIFIILLDRESTPPVLATLIVFFVFYTATSAGLSAATKAHREMMLALGASRLARLIHLDLPAALPAIAGGMKLAVPTALIGAILGEWFGASRGLGVLIVSAMQNFQIPLLWSAVLLVSATSLILFSALSVFEKFVTERFR